MNSDKMITNNHYQLARMVNTGIEARYNENVQSYRLISSIVSKSCTLFFSFTALFEYQTFCCYLIQKLNIIIL